MAHCFDLEIVFIKKDCIIIVPALSSLTLYLATQKRLICFQHPIQHTPCYIFTLATKFMMWRNKTGIPAGVGSCFLSG
jgi:hypothetical protein